VEIYEVGGGAGEESGDRGGWLLSLRGEWRQRRLVVEHKRKVEIDEVGGGAAE
jgi:hypothetical protein